MLAFVDEYVPGPRADPVRIRIPVGFRFGGLTRPGSLDAPVLFSCAAAVILLLPLRGLSAALPPVAFAETLVLFAAPGLLVSHWLLGDDLSWPAMVPAGFVISTGVFGLLGVPALILHLSIDAYLLAAGVVLCAFLAIAAWRAVRGFTRTVGPSGKKSAPYGALSRVRMATSRRRR